MSGCKTCKNCTIVGPGVIFCAAKGITQHYVSKCDKYKGKNKYNNQKSVNIDGIVFDSKKEMSRYEELIMLQKTGIIQDLKRQVKFVIIPKFSDERATFYVADFTYTKADGKKYCEDVKSEITKKNAAYILKRKLFKYLYPDYIFIEN